MINQKSFEAVKAASWKSDFCKPLYESYCFSKIPSTLLKLLGLSCDTLPQDCFHNQTYETVVLFVIDGFGWSFLEKTHHRYPFLSRFFREGIVSKITSQFPSTTAAHITSLCSGLEVAETGIYEWFYYEPILDRVIAPLLYSYAGDKSTGTLKGDLTPDEIFPAKTVFQTLQKNKISSTIFQHSSISNSSYSDWMFRGAEMVPYDNVSKGLQELQSRLGQKGLFYFYIGDIDAVAHRNGLDSKQTAKAIDQCFTALENFWRTLPQDQKMACVVTADHGMTAIDPKTTIYLNQAFPFLEEVLEKGSDGHPLTPAGSCRDYFLHISPKEVARIKPLLEEGLQGKALICETSELIEEGFFGSKPVCKDLLERLGNLVILPYGNNSIWWYEKGRFEQKFYAMHGGLTREEMETIFLFI